MLDSNTLQTITSDDVFSCQEIVVKEGGTVFTPYRDFAILRLDRPATPRFTPANIVGTEASAVTDGTPLVMIGAPNGVPFKIDDGGSVIDSHQYSLNYFETNNDSFGGNSGSGIWNQDTKEVVGILSASVREHYIEDESADCKRVKHCIDPSYRGCYSGVAIYAFHAVKALSNGIPGCISETIYGEHSQETELLRSIRDNVLSQTQEGQELIKLYYQWSPIIVRAMEADEDFKQEVKEMVEEVLGVVE
jgi:hypothetical protein